MPDAWFKSDEAKKIAANVLSHQSPLGSWPKNTDTGAKPFAGNPKDLRGTVKKITGSGANVYAAIEEGAGYGGVAISTDNGQSFTIRAVEDGLASTTVEDVFVDGSNLFPLKIEAVTLFQPQQVAGGIALDPTDWPTIPSSWRQPSRI